MLGFEERRQTIVFVLSYLDSSGGDPFGLSESSIEAIQRIANTYIGNRQLKIARSDLNEKIDGFPSAWRKEFSLALNDRCQNTAKWFLGK